MDSIDDILGEVPLPPYVTVEDVTFAIKAISVHAASSGQTVRAAATTGHPTRAGCTAGAAASSTSAASPTGRSTH